MAEQESDQTRPRRALGDTDPDITQRRRSRLAPTPEVDERPLYRDEVADGGPSGTNEADRPAGSRAVSGDRSGTAALRRTTARRTRLGLLIAAIAAVVVGGLALGYALLRPPADQPGALPPTAGSAAPNAGSSSPSDDPAALLTDRFALTAPQATTMVAGRTWRVASTQRGTDDQSPVPACLPGPADQETAPTQTLLRQLSSSGKTAPAALHQVGAYATPQEAAQAYAAEVRSLGSCAMPGAYLQSAQTVTGLGDQAAAAVVHLNTGAKTAQLRSVVVNRTGRVVNVVDVAQPATAVPTAKVAQALAAVTNAQCSAAGGRCAKAVTVKDGPPPPGGDQPGFLAAGDLPPVGAADATWAGTVPARPSPDFVGSGCETVNWAKVPAVQRATRTYLLADSSPQFGLDDVVVTSPNARAASTLAAKVKADLDSCAKRKLTATVSGVRPVRGVGAGGTPVTGWTATVQQKTTAGTVGYRVGVVSARTKTVFTFLNPQQRLNFDDAQWTLVTVRAGQRATQVK